LKRKKLWEIFLRFEDFILDGKLKVFCEKKEEENIFRPFSEFLK